MLQLDANHVTYIEAILTSRAWGCPFIEQLIGVALDLWSK